MNIESVSPEDTVGWDDFVTQHPHGSFYHSALWQALVANTFGHPQLHLAARTSGGSLVGVLSLVRLKSPLFGHYCVSLPYVNFGGALGETPQIEHELMEDAASRMEKLGVSHIEFRDLAPREDRWPVRTDKVSMELALPNTTEEFMQGIGSKLRSQVKRPLRDGATVAHGGLELVKEFYRVFSENMRDLGTPVYAERLFAGVLERFPNDARITVVRVGDESAAAGLTLSYRGRTEIPWASSLRRFNRIGVNMLLYAEIIKQAIGNRQSTFDFGRSTVDAGTYRFKRQWGAEPRQLHWHYWLPPGSQVPALNPDNPKYAMAIRAWTRLPLPIANAIGPHIVKYLP